jgi:two-component system sensor histidine kinase KdpD
VADSQRDEDWRRLAGAAVRSEAEWEVSAWPLVGCRLMVGQHVIGALLLEVPETRPPDTGFLLAQARMAALALERIDLSLRLSDARAAAAPRAETALLASVSHDLRSPLTAISTSAASLLPLAAV